MKKTNKTLVFTIEAAVEVPAEDVWRLSEIQEVVEHLQGIGTADIVDVQVRELDRKVKC